MIFFSSDFFPCMGSIRSRFRIQSMINITKKNIIQFFPFKILTLIIISSKSSNYSHYPFFPFQAYPAPGETSLYNVLSFDSIAETDLQFLLFSNKHINILIQHIPNYLLIFLFSHFHIIQLLYQMFIHLYQIHNLCL